MAQGIVSSTEYVDSALQSTYLGLLDRAASGSELSIWSSQLLNGVHFEEIEAQVAGSNEFYAKNH